MQLKYQEALNRAITNRNQNQLTKLITKIKRDGLIDAKFDLMDYEKITLLMLFVLSNNLTMVQKLLIDWKANRLITDTDNQNALYMATHLALSSPTYDYKIVTMLLTNLPKEQIISQERLTGHTVVSFCALQNNPIATGFLRLFLDITTEPLNLTTNNGDYPIHLACTHGEATTLTTLLKYQPKQQVLLAGQFNELPIHTLLSRDLTDSLPLLLAHAAKEQLQSRAESGMTILHIAALQLQFSTLKLLRDHQLLPDLVNIPFGEHAQTALHLAITTEDGNPEQKAERHVHWFVKELLQNGADVMAGGGKIIPLLRCCQYNFVSVAKLLLQQRQEEQLTSRDCENFIPLITACFYGAHSVVDYLLEFTCNQTLKQLTHLNNSGQSALHLAINYYIGHQEQATHILSMAQSLLKFFPQEQLAIISLGITPLLRATAHGFIDMVSLLMQFDCQTQLVPQNEPTILPIHCACDRENVPMVRVLLQQQAFAQLNASYLGLTPLYQAILRQNLELIQLIVATDPTTLLTQLSDGVTILHTAAFIGNATIAEYILKLAPQLIAQISGSNHLPITLAIMENAIDVFMLFWSHSSQRQQYEIAVANNAPLEFLAIHYCCLDILRELLKEQENCSTLQRNGENLLQAAIAKNRHHIAQFLRTEKGMLVEPAEPEIPVQKPIAQTTFISNKKTPKIWWINHTFTNGSIDLKRILVINNPLPCYLYIPTAIKNAAGFSPEFWQTFFETRLREDQCLAELPPTLIEKVTFCDVAFRPTYEFILQINDNDALLLFTLNADDDNGRLLVAGRFIPNNHLKYPNFNLETKIRSGKGIHIAAPAGSQIKPAEMSITHNKK